MLSHSSTTESRMAWNEPGGSQDKDPWGGRRKTSGPPDLDVMIRKLQQKFNSIFRGEGSRDVSVLGESLMLTQVEYIVEVKLAIQYKVKSPDDYLLFDRNPDITMRDGAESAIREVVGKSKMDFI